jgi:hypothetical protein
MHLPGYTFCDSGLTLFPYANRVPKLEREFQCSETGINTGVYASALAASSRATSTRGKRHLPRWEKECGIKAKNSLQLPRFESFAEMGDQFRKRELRAKIRDGPMIGGRDDLVAAQICFGCKCGTVLSSEQKPSGPRFAKSGGWGLPGGIGG